MAAPIAAAADLRASLDALAEAVESVPFAAPAVAQGERWQLRDDLAWSVREYLLPRLADIGGPARVVVVGSTGSGKSTIVNSIAQQRIGEPGPLRPTTRIPVLWCHQRHEAAYAFGFLTGYGTSEDSDRPLRIVAGLHPLLDAMSLLDVPDFDSVEEMHHEMAAQLLAVADVCIFVTTAQRYADAVPWKFLERARERGIPVIHVMNRMPPEGEAAVDDYRARLRERGIPVNLFLTIDEQVVDPDHGGLPEAAVERLVHRLEILTDPEQRRRLLEETTHTAIANAFERLEELVRHVREERAELQALLDVAAARYGAQCEEIAAELERGDLIRSQVVHRWQNFLGTGELFKALNEGAARVRGWLSRVLGGSSPAAQVEREVRDELASVVSRRAGRAAASTSAAWDLDVVGAGVLSDHGYDLWHEDAQTGASTRSAVDDWMAALSSHIQEQGAGRRKFAQVASAGVNAAAVAVTVGVFAHTGGITGAELGVAAGAAAVQQKILEHVFGSAAARSLIAQGRRTLLEAVETVFDRDRSRFDDALAGLMPPAGLEDRLVAAGGAVIEQGQEFYAG